MTTLATLQIVYEANARDFLRVADQVERRAGTLERDFGGLRKAIDGAFIGAGIAAFNTALAGTARALKGVFGGSIGAAATFQQTMSGVQAVTGTTAAEFANLSALALQLGKDTVFSASDAATAMSELAKGGVSVADIMAGALKATLDLASAGSISLADAAEIASNALAIFGLKGSDMAKVSDLIAGAANASSLSVTDFKYSMAMAGAVASASGQTFDDLALAIAIMGKNGLKGSDAGTSLKTMLMNLLPTTNKQTEAMRQLGLITADGQNKFLNANGSFKSMADIAAILNDATKGLTDSQRVMYLEMIFGSDAVRAAAIFAKEGATGFDDMSAAMGKVTAAGVASVKLDNLRGSVEQLKGSLETAGIALGITFLPLLRDVVDAGTRAVNGLIPLIEASGPNLAAALTQGAQNLLAFGRSALATGQTIAGSIQSTLAQASTQLQQTTATVGQFTQGWRSALVVILPFVAGFGGTIAAATAAAAAFGALVPLLASLASGLAFLLTPLGLVALAVGTVAAAWYNWDRVGPIVDDLAARVARLIPPATRVAALALIATIEGFNYGGAWDAFIVTLNQLATSARPAVTALADLYLAISPTGAVLSSLTGQFNIFTALFQALEPVLRNTAGALAVGLAGALAALWPLLQQLGTTVSNLRPQFIGIGQSLLGLWNALIPAATVIGGVLVLAVGAALTTFGSLIGMLNGALPGAVQVLNGAIQFATGVIQAITGSISGMVNIVKALLRGDWASAWQAAQQALADMQRASDNIMAGLQNIFRGAFSAILGGIQGFASGGQAMFLGFFDGIFRQATGSTNSIQQVLANNWQRIEADLRGIWSGISGGAASAWNGITSTIANTVDDVRTRISRNWQQIQSEISGTWLSITGTASSTWNGITTIVGGAVDTVRSTVERVMQDLSSTWERVNQTIASIGQRLWDSLAADIISAVVNLGATILSEWTQTRDALDRLLDALSQRAIGVFTDLARQVLGVVTTFTADVLAGFQSWKNELDRVWDQIEQKATAAWDAVRSYLAVTAADMQAKVEAPVVAARTTLEQVWTNIEQKAIGAWDAVRGYLSVTGADMQAKIQAPIDLARVTLDTTWTQIEGKATAAWDAVRAYLTVTAADMQAKLQQPITAGRDALVGVWTSFESNATTAWDNVRGVMERGGAAMKNALLWPFDQGSREIGDVLKWFANNMIGSLNAGSNKVRDFGMGVRNIINWVADKLGAGVPIPGEPPNVDIPALYTGAVNFPGGPAIVGEQGPELVYLPQHATVIPADLTQTLLDAGVPGFAGGLNLGPLGSIIDVAKKGAGWLYDQGAQALGVGVPALGGALTGFGQAMFDQAKGWAVRVVDDLIKRAMPAPTISGGYAFPVVGYSGSIEPHGGPAYIGGADIFSALGTPLVVMRGGSASVSNSGPGGNNVYVSADDGLAYYYAHMRDAPLFGSGAVTTGQAMGYIGTTGNAAGTSPHLHIGIGPSISSGVGAPGGLGINADGSFYDAVSLLRSVLAGGGKPGSAPAGGGGGGGAVPDAVLGTTGDPRGQLALLMGSWMEGGWNPPYPVGDNGKAFGPYQIWTSLWPISEADAQSAWPATAFAWSQLAYRNTIEQVTPQSLWQTDPWQAGALAAYYAERPYAMYPQSRIAAAFAASRGIAGFADGGIITEPIVGRGLRSGTTYTFGEDGREYVIPERDVTPREESRGQTLVTAPIAQHFYGVQQGDVQRETERGLRKVATEWSLGLA